MINAKKARANSDYYLSEQRKKDVRKDYINHAVMSITKEIEKESKEGKTSLTLPLRLSYRLQTLCLIEISDLEDVKEELEKLGFNVTTEVRDSNSLEKTQLEYFKNNLGIKGDKIPEITIKW